MSTIEEAEAQLISILARMASGAKHNQLSAHYQKTADEGGWQGPYNWQAEFHNAGSHSKDRAIIAANQTGKTRTAAAEVSVHMTGRYPPWWRGYRFNKPNDWLAAGTTNEQVRNIVQKALVGVMTEGKRVPDGSGWIPSECIGECFFRSSNVSNVLETVKIKHVSGESSTLKFQSYEQGSGKFQGYEVDGVWLDEEPPLHHQDIFSEVQTRLIARSGHLLFTRTPLLGRSRIVQYFLNGGPGIWYTTATWDQAPHLSKADRERLWQNYPEHERATRTKGDPLMGSGGVYSSAADEDIKCEPFPDGIPQYFRRICGIDFGIDHPFAAVWIAYDADNDTIYLYDAYKISGQTASYHTQMLKSRGNWIPISWPHDGMIRDKGGGIALKDQYLHLGCNMLGVSARYSDDKGGGQAREPATLDLLDRMKTGRFKVYSHLHEWFAEKRMLHREDAKIVAHDDDLESATRYACMMLRYAVSDAEVQHEGRQPLQNVSMDYDPLARYSRSKPGVTTYEY